MRRAAAWVRRSPADWQDRTLVLSDEAALKIYVNRQRMRLVELMTTLARPATAKMLSVRMGISASSVKHHLDKLVSIGVVEVDHREHIHGILATYYRVTDRTIVLDSTDPALRPFTEQIVQDNFGQLLQGCWLHWPPGRPTRTQAGRTPGG